MNPLADTMKKSDRFGGSGKENSTPLRFSDWNTLHYLLLWAYEGEVHLSGREGKFTDDAISCWLIRQGWVEVRAGGEKVVARRGEWILVGGPTRHQRFSHDAKILSIHFELSWFAGGSAMICPRSLLFRSSSLPALEHNAIRLARLLARHFPKADTFLPIQPCSLELFMKLQGAFPPVLTAYLQARELLGVSLCKRRDLDPRVLAATFELDRIPFSHRVCEKDLASRHSLSRSHFAALFTEQTGTTPRKYLEARRLKTARHLLGKTCRSIKEIAFDLGFRHESNFCLWFKRLAGHAPSYLRR